MSPAPCRPPLAATRSGPAPSTPAAPPARRRAGRGRARAAGGEARHFPCGPGRGPPRAGERDGEDTIEAILRFETAVGEGAGLARIKRADAAAGAPPPPGPRRPA